MVWLEGDGSFQIGLPFVERFAGRCKDQVERNLHSGVVGKFDRTMDVGRTRGPVRTAAVSLRETTGRPG